LTDYTFIRRLIWPVSVILASLSATALSFILSIGRSVWFDEGYTIIIIHKPFHNMINLIRVDAHPPLYYLILRLWVSLVGDDVWKMRLLSTIFLGLTILISLLMLRTLTNEKTALKLIPFMIFSPILLRYGYEIRMYSLLVFLSVLGTYMLVLAVKNSINVSKSNHRSLKSILYDNRYWITYSIIVALGMYTQYIIATVWIAHVVILIILTVKNKIRIIQWVWTYALSIIIFMPWISTMLWQIEHPVIPDSTSMFNIQGILNLLTILLIGIDLNRITASMTAILLIFIVIIVINQFNRSYKTNKGIRERMVLYGMLGMFIIPIITILFINIILESTGSSDLFFTPRYATSFSPYFYMAIGLFCVNSVSNKNNQSLDNIVHSFHEKMSRWVSYFLALALLISGSIGYIFQGNYIYEDNATPYEKDISKLVTCSKSSPVIADDEHVYISYYEYFKDCKYFFFITTGSYEWGGYAIINDSKMKIANVHGVDHMKDVDKITYLIHPNGYGYDHFITEINKRHIVKIINIGYLSSITVINK
jgi:uncharacterized membrane protein